VHPLQKGDPTIEMNKESQITPSNLDLSQSVAWP
jgi:hypothetical protein